MKKVIYILMFLTFAGMANAQWVQMSNGMGNDKYVRAFTMNGNNIFAGTYGQGVYLSTNNGSNWSQTISSPPQIRSLASSGNNIFAGTNAGVYLSTNNGTNWTLIGLVSYWITSLTVTGNYLFAGHNGTGVWLSTNSGTNWTNTSLNNADVSSLASNGNNIFAGAGGTGGSPGLYFSSNNGTNWVMTSLNDKNIYSLFINGNSVYAGTGGSGVYLSTNNGNTWTQTNLNNRYVYAVSAYENKVFAGTDNGIYLSTNNGLNWYNKSQGFNNTLGIYALLIANNYIFAGTSSQSVWRLDLNYPLPAAPQLVSPADNSLDNPLYLNLGWKKIQYAMLYNVLLATDASFNNIIIDSLVTDTTLAITNLNTFTNYYWKVRVKIISDWSPFSNYFTFRTGSPWSPMYTGMSGNKTVNTFTTIGNNIFTGTSTSGVYKSTNNGISWTATNNGLTNQNVLSLTANSNILYAGTSGSGIFQSTSNGEYWIAVSNGLGNNTVKSLLSKGSSVFAGTSSGVYVTTNNGGVWTASGLPYIDVRILYLNGSDILAGTYGGGVYLSTDNGINWFTRNNGLSNLNVYSIVVNGSNLYAGTSAGVYLSTNYGLNWTAGWLTNQTIYTLAASNNRIFAGSNTGSLVSFDNGLSWININFGFSGVNNVYAYLLNGNYIFAGTNNSVWRRVLSEVIGIKNISSEVPSTYSLSQNYPNPFNPTTRISFKVASYKVIKLQVFDILGKEVATLVNEKLQPGTYEATFDASAYTSGVYFYRLTTDNYTDVKKMILLK